MWGGAVLSGVLATIAAYSLFDKPSMQWFAHHPDHWHRIGWVNAFRQLGKAYVLMWLVLLWGLMTNHWRATVTVCVALALVALTVCPLKAIAHRKRPGQQIALAAVPVARGHAPSWISYASFPSGDTATVFAVATVLMVFSRRIWAPVFFMAAASVGWLRITMLAHYPSDVLAGVLIGVLAGWFAIRLAKRWPWVDRLEMTGWARAVLGGLLAVVLPLIGPLIGIVSLEVFVRIYGIPVMLLMLLGAWISRMRPQTRHDACE